jgi:aspartate carbamoyltransferase catalytic subunit
MTEQTRHILKTEQFADQELLGDLLERSDYFARSLKRPDSRRNLLSQQAGRIMFNMFYEPSTRTSFSFQMAAARLGIRVVGTENGSEFSSISKGETLADTARVLAGSQPDVIVLRHPEEGAAEEMAAYTKGIPVINAGDGKNEHPTQALLDVYTIDKEFGRTDNLRIVVGGDIDGGRTAKSLVRLLGLRDSNSIELVAPERTNASPELKKEWEDLPAEVRYTYELDESTLESADVVYWTRTQTERGNGHVDPNFVLARRHLGSMSAQGIVMHPLPRAGDLLPDIDEDPRARYFQQAANGVPTRMALLDYVLEQ